MDRDALNSERAGLIEQIIEAFRGVTRVGGVSWREASVIDSYGTDDERDAARALDTERDWLELLGPGRWRPDPSGELSFLDEIGFRYYLAPAMILVSQGHPDFGLQYHLGRPHTHNPSLFNKAQRLAIGRFLRFMIEEDRLRWADSDVKMDDPMGWRETYESYWKDECESAPKQKKGRP